MATKRELEFQLERMRVAAGKAMIEATKALDERDAALARAEKAEGERDEARRWVTDLQSGMWINCVYCGHRYGPRDSTPVSMADVLKAHVETCPEHPMSKLRTEARRCREALEAVGEALRRCDAIRCQEACDLVDAALAPPTGRDGVPAPLLTASRRRGCAGCSRYRGGRLVARASATQLERDGTPAHARGQHMYQVGGGACARRCCRHRARRDEGGGEGALTAGLLDPRCSI
jgi:hypothetical protein